MAKNQRQNRTNTRIDQEYDRTNQDYDRYRSDLESRRTSTQARADELYGRSRAGYEGLIPRYRGIGGDARNLGRDARSAGSRYAGKFNALGDEVAGFARNPISDADKNRMRGLGVFDEFAQTGGWSEGDKQDVLASIASRSPAMFANLKENLDRQKLSQGGMGAGYTSQAAKLARDSARAGATDLREGRIGLGESIRSGRQWGAEGAATSEANLQNTLIDTYMRGMGLSGDMYGRGAGAEFQGLGMDLSSMGLDLDSARAEQGIYDQYSRMYGDESDRAQRYDEMTGRAIGDQHGATRGTLGLDIENNPRQRPWWEVALEAAVPIGSAFMMSRRPNGGTTQNTGVTGGRQGRLPTPVSSRGLGGRNLDPSLY